MGMVEVSRIIGLCSRHLTIRIPSSVLEAMGVLPIPSACVRVCVRRLAYVRTCLWETQLIN